MKQYIVRKKYGKSFKYYDKRGNLLPKSKVKSYLNFYIPPAYDDVKINMKKLIVVIEEPFLTVISAKNFVNAKAVAFDIFLLFFLSKHKILGNRKNVVTKVTINPSVIM